MTPGTGRPGRAGDLPAAAGEARELQKIARQSSASQSLAPLMLHYVRKTVALEDDTAHLRFCSSAFRRSLRVIRPQDEIGIATGVDA